MGLDIYFVKREKKFEGDILSDKAEMTSLLSTLLANANDDSDKNEVFRLLQQLQTYANRLDHSFEYELKRALESYLRGHDNSTSEEIAYFRKFYFLRTYFDYNDAWYGEDKVVSKEQIGSLLSISEKAIKEVIKYFTNKGYTIISSPLEKVYDFCNGYLQIRNYKMTDEDYKAADLICDKWFGKEVDLFKNVCILCMKCKEILRDVDFDKEELMMNADW